MPLADTEHIKSFNLGYTRTSCSMIPVSANTYEHCQTQHAALVSPGPSAMVALAEVFSLLFATPSLTMPQYNSHYTGPKQTIQKASHTGKSILWFLTFMSKKKELLMPLRTDENNHLHIDSWLVSTYKIRMELGRNVKAQIHTDISVPEGH